MDINEDDTGAEGAMVVVKLNSVFVVILSKPLLVLLRDVVLLWLLLSSLQEGKEPGSGGNVGLIKACSIRNNEPRKAPNNIIGRRRPSLVTGMLSDHKPINGVNINAMTAANNTTIDKAAVLFKSPTMEMI